MKEVLTKSREIADSASEILRGTLATMERNLTESFSTPDAQGAASLGLLDEETVASTLGVKVTTLRAWRARRKAGPPHIAVGRTILYRSSALEKWLVEREVDYGTVGRTGRARGSQRAAQVAGD